jgi:hypothetical protein
VPDDRDLPPRRRLRQQRRVGVPVEIDPELTPPPTSVDAIDKMHDSIPPPISEQLRRLAAGLEQVWDARNDGARFDRIETHQGHVAKDLAEIGALLREFIMPAIKASQQRIDQLLQHHEANRIRVEMFYDREWPAAVKSLEGMTERLGRVERGLERSEMEMRGMGDRLNAAHGTLSDRVAAQDATVQSLALRVVSLELVKRDEDVGAKAIAKRDRRITGTIGSILGFLSGLAASFLK